MNPCKTQSNPFKTLASTYSQCKSVFPIAPLSAARVVLWFLAEHFLQGGPKNDYKIMLSHCGSYLILFALLWSVIIDFLFFSQSKTPNPPSFSTACWNLSMLPLFLPGLCILGGSDLHNTPLNEYKEKIQI